MDLAADRRHHSKRHRPLAAGDLPLWVGLLLAPLLMAGGGVLAWWTPAPSGWFPAIYLSVSLAYCWWLKRVGVLDIMALASLYTLRVLAGGEATGTEVSHWLLIFAMFLFFSLAFLKRHAELDNLGKRERRRAPGRGYEVGDKTFVAMGGVASGFASVIILALHLNSAKVSSRYAPPELLTILCPLLIYWACRLWQLASRGQMKEDPVLFALKDPASYLTGGLWLAVLYLAV